MCHSPLCLLHPSSPQNAPLLPLIALPIKRTFICANYYLCLFLVSRQSSMMTQTISSAFFFFYSPPPVFMGDTCRLIPRRRKRTMTNPRRSAASPWPPRTSKDVRRVDEEPSVCLSELDLTACAFLHFSIYLLKEHTFIWFLYCVIVLYMCGLTVALGMSQTAISIVLLLLFPSLHYLQYLGVDCFAMKQL